MTIEEQKIREKIEALEEDIERIGKQTAQLIALKPQHSQSYLAQEIATCDLVKKQIAKLRADLDGR